MKIEEMEDLIILKKVEAGDFNEGVFSVPENVNTLGVAAFSGQTKLEKLILSPSVTNIDSFALAGCRNLETINLENVITVRDGAFINCAFTSLSLKNVQVISLNAFSNCEQLEYLNLNSKSLQLIDDNAFKGCTHLKTLILSGNTVRISPNAFGNFTHVERIIIDAENDNDFTRIQNSLPVVLRSRVTPMTLLADIERIQGAVQEQFESDCKLNALKNLPPHLISKHITSRAPILEVIQLQQTWTLIPLPTKPEDLAQYRERLELVSQRHICAYKLNRYLEILLKVTQLKETQGFFSGNKRKFDGWVDSVNEKILLKKLINSLQKNELIRLSDDERMLINKQSVLKLIPETLQKDLGLHAPLFPRITFNTVREDIHVNSRK